MLVVFAVLTAGSAILLVVGLIWWLAAHGKTVHRSGPEVGAEIMGSSIGDDDGPAGMTLLDQSAFAGDGIQVERSASVSYAEVKRMLRERAWRVALPPLLAMLGLYFFIVFGALTLWFSLEDKIVASVVAGAAIATVIAPIAIGAAQQAGLDPRSLAMGVALASSMAFLTPLGHPVNILVMGPGGYKFKDYLRVGWPLTVVIFALAMLLLPVFWPLMAR